VASEGDPAVLRIGELARRVGVSQDLLRAWERRYGLLKPARSPGGFRLYSNADEQRVRRMQAHLALGLAAAQAARAALDEETEHSAPRSHQRQPQNPPRPTPRRTPTHRLPGTIAAFAEVAQVAQEDLSKGGLHGEVGEQAVQHGLSGGLVEVV